MVHLQDPKNLSFFFSKPGEMQRMTDASKRELHELSVQIVYYRIVQ
jgi:hypothetical protein